MPNMAARTSVPNACYVYRIFDGVETVYVGTGTGRRIDAQKRRFGCDGEIIARDLNDDDAFKAERRWIAELMPTQNVHPGGNGGRCRPKPKTKAEREFAAFERKLHEEGPRRHVARFLLRKIDETNCEKVGVSKVDVSRLREVANGGWC
jgi:hypothetical protein